MTAPHSTEKKPVASVIININRGNQLSVLFDGIGPRAARTVLENALATINKTLK